MAAPMTEEMVRRMIENAIVAERQRIAEQIISMPIPKEVHVFRCCVGESTSLACERPGFNDFRNYLAAAIMKGL